MAVREGRAEWQGGLPGGKGTLSTETGVVSASYTFASRFEEERGTNPEELIAAAHAACFSMAFSGNLTRAGHEPRRVATTARVHLEKGEDGFAIRRIELRSEAEVPGISEEEFLKQADAAKAGCPVSKALAAVPVELDARLLSA